jgi:ribosomal protein L16 Arg81 hydroxylase
MERVMEDKDSTFDGARWGIVHTKPDNPFVIGDAPVVIWHRDQQGVAHYGIGFREPNVEVLLPISPTACLHVLPNVQRTRTVITPKTSEVNAAEAAFAEACYTDVCSNPLNQHLQQFFGRAKMGINAFSLRHKDYVAAFCNHLISHGVPPNI